MPHSTQYMFFFLSTATAVCGGFAAGCHAYRRDQSDVAYNSNAVSNKGE